MVAARSAYTKCVRICKRNYDNEYTQRLTMSMHSNLKEFWKSFRPGKRTSPTTIKPNDFFVYFKSISNHKNIIYEADDDIFEYLRTYQQGQLQTEYDQLNFSITDSEVHKAVSELKCGKAAGNDLLINELYICADAILLPKLTCLFNVIFKSSHFPTAWREGVIVPFF